MKKRIASLFIAVVIVLSMSIVAFAKVPTTNPNAYSSSNATGIVSTTWTEFVSLVSSSRTALKANDTDDKYIPESLVGLRAVIDSLDAKSNLSWASATEAEIIGYTADLQDAYDSLVEITDFSALKAQIKAVSGVIRAATDDNGAYIMENGQYKLVYVFFAKTNLYDVDFASLYGDGEYYPNYPYTKASMNALAAALREAIDVYNTRNTGAPASQKEIKNATAALKEAFDDLEALPGYYGDVMKALDAVPGFKAEYEKAQARAAARYGTTYVTDMAVSEFLYNESLKLLYTDETVDALYDAVNAVEWDLTALDQDKIDAYEKAIRTATAALEIRDHDAMEVVVALKEAEMQNGNVVVDVADETIDKVFEQLQADVDANKEAVEGEGGSAAGDDTAAGGDSSAAGGNDYAGDGIIPDTGDAVALTAFAAVSAAAAVAFILKKRAH